jgi:hypothetical protein
MQLQAIELQQGAEKLVGWHTKSSLKEGQVCHDVSPHRNRGRGIFGHTISS